MSKREHTEVVFLKSPDWNPSGQKLSLRLTKANGNSKYIEAGEASPAGHKSYPVVTALQEGYSVSWRKVTLQSSREDPNALSMSISCFLFSA